MHAGEAEFADWLGEVLWVHYGELFMANGFDSLEVLQNLTEEQLDVMLAEFVPIAKAGHRFLLENKLAELRGTAPPTTSPVRRRTPPRVAGRPVAPDRSPGSRPSSPGLATPPSEPLSASAVATSSVKRPKSDKHLRAAQQQQQQRARPAAATAAATPAAEAANTSRRSSPARQPTTPPLAMLRLYDPMAPGSMMLAPDDTDTDVQRNRYAHMNRAHASPHDDHERVGHAAPHELAGAKERRIAATATRPQPAASRPRSSASASTTRASPSVRRAGGSPSATRTATRQPSVPSSAIPRSPAAAAVSTTAAPGKPAPSSMYSSAQATTSPRLGPRDTRSPPPPPDDNYARLMSLIHEAPAALRKTSTPTHHAATAPPPTSAFEGGMRMLPGRASSPVASPTVLQPGSPQRLYFS